MYFNSNTVHFFIIFYGLICPNATLREKTKQFDDKLPYLFFRNIK